MKTGIATGIFDRNKISLEEALAIIKQVEIEYIELWTVFYGAKPFFAWKEKSIVDKVSKFCAINNIKIHSIHAPFSFEYELASLDCGIRTKVIQDIKEVVDVANDLGTKVVVVHPASKPDSNKNNLSKEEYELKFSFIKDGLKEIVEYIIKKKYNVKIALENQLPHIMCSTTEELLDLINSLDKNIVGVCLDTGHAELFNITNSLCDMMEKLKNYLLNVHVSDTNGKNDEHLLFGEGRIRWYNVAKILQSINYQNPFMIEILSLLKDTDIKVTLLEAKKRVKTLFKDW